MTYTSSHSTCNTCMFFPAQTHIRKALEEVNFKQQNHKFKKQSNNCNSMMVLLCKYYVTICYFYYIFWLFHYHMNFRISPENRSVSATNITKWNAKDTTPYPLSPNQMQRRGIVALDHSSYQGKLVWPSNKGRLPLQLQRNETCTLTLTKMTTCGINSKR